MNAEANSRHELTVVPGRRSRTVLSQYSDVSAVPNAIAKLLVALTAAQRKLAGAVTLQDVVSARDQAEAAKSFSRSARLGRQIQNQASALKLRAEREAGKILTELRLRGGDRKSNSHSARLTLAELGITQNESTRWQRMASILDEVFEEYIAHCLATSVDVCSAAFLRFGRSRLGTKTNLPRRSQVGMASDVSVVDSEVIRALSEQRLHFERIREIAKRISESDGNGIPSSDERLLMRYITELIGEWDSVIGVWLRSIDQSDCLKS